ncbi:MAG: ketopantoate reductase family protein [Candidatus Heimdallarchaeaceae archaeon]
MNKKPTILIAGIGAVGSVLLVRLSKLGLFRIVCLTSERGCDLIRQRGLSVKLVDDLVPKLYHPLIFSSLPETYKAERFNKCIISTKAYNNQALADYLTDFLSDDASILLFQNGLDTEHTFIEKGKNWRITRALSSIGSRRENRNRVIETAKGKTFIGSLNHNNSNDLVLWSVILSRIGLETEISVDIQKDIWLKTIVNAAINPLGAITRLENGRIIQDEYLLGIIKSLIEEILKICSLIGVDISFSEAFRTVLTVAKTTASNKCSMLQDISRGLRTEIDYINGAIVSVGKKEGVQTPINSFIVDIIKRLETKELSPELAFMELRAINRIAKI